MTRGRWKDLAAPAAVAAIAVGLAPACGSEEVLETPEETVEYSAQELGTPEGRVEFIGLHHWTPEQVRDTLAALRPDVPLTSGACAVVLREDAGFPQAAVTRYSFQNRPAQDHIVITLVEPEERDRVRYLSSPPDSLGPRERWAMAYDILENRPWAWNLATQYRYSTPGPEMWAGREGVDTMDLYETRDFLERHATEQDLDLAIEILTRDRNVSSRIIAVGILAGFPNREESWHALIRAARGFGPDDWGRDRVSVTINTLDRQVPDSMDWSPVAEDLSALLDGTNLYAFIPLLEVLTRTGLPPELTRELMSGGAPLVIDHLAAKSSRPRQAARRFLERVSGEQHGDDVEAWRMWIAGLGT